RFDLGDLCTPVFDHGISRKQMADALAPLRGSARCASSPSIASRKKMPHRIPDVVRSAHPKRADIVRLFRKVQEQLADLAIGHGPRERRDFQEPRIVAVADEL